jgi:hypothetical protein
MMKGSQSCITSYLVYHRHSISAGRSDNIVGIVLIFTVRPNSRAFLYKIISTLVALTRPIPFEE